MALLNFKASKLYRQVTTTSYFDEQGDYHPGTDSYEFCCDCDVEPAGQANKITIPDGQVETYSFTISNMPREVEDFCYGDFIKLQHQGREFTLKVKGFQRYQYQCKIWA